MVFKGCCHLLPFIDACYRNLAAIPGTILLHRSRSLAGWLALKGRFRTSDQWSHLNLIFGTENHFSHRPFHGPLGRGGSGQWPPSQVQIFLQLYISSQPLPCLHTPFQTIRVLRPCMFCATDYSRYPSLSNTYMFWASTYALPILVI